MTKKMLVIVPSRGRPTNAGELTCSFFENSYVSDLCFGLDSDDTSEYVEIKNVMYSRTPRVRMGGTLNYLANKYCSSYEYICFMGDDHRPRTVGWDEKLIEPLEGTVGFSYGNDLLQGRNLPTAVVLSSNIIQTLGYIVPETLRHFHFDTFWKEMGIATETLHYFEDVVIEHMHPLAQKSEVDNTYSQAWTILDEDTRMYDVYKRLRFDSDVEKIRSLCENLNNRT